MMKDSLYLGIIVGIIAMILGLISVIAEDTTNKLSNTCIENRIEERR